MLSITITEIHMFNSLVFGFVRSTYHKTTFQIANININVETLRNEKASHLEYAVIGLLSCFLFQFLG